MSKISSLAGNAVLAKSRAMNSGILTEENYTALINCRNISEIVSYLKSNTVYSDSQALTSVSSFSKARLETELRKFNYERINSLASFEKAIGQKLNEIIYLNYDIALILSCADHLDSNQISNLALLTSRSYLRRSGLDLSALESATDFNAFYEALNGTPYQKALAVFKHKAFSITALENALYQYMCERVEKLVKDNYSSSDRNELLNLFKMKSDFKMAESIYRMKKYFPNEPCNFENIFYSGFSAFSVTEINKMINCSDIDELFAVFEKSVYGKYIDESFKDNIEHCSHKAQLKINKKNLLFSTVPEVVMFSYIGILENETKNIIMITEGVDYSLPPEEISKFLTV